VNGNRLANAPSSGPATKASSWDPIAIRRRKGASCSRRARFALGTPRQFGISPSDQRVEGGIATAAYAMSLDPRNLGYRPEIDGLRAVAVILVMLFHAEVGPVPGGFVGVDERARSQLACGDFLPDRG
jgi:hypothetical protein